MGSKESGSSQSETISKPTPERAEAIKKFLAMATNQSDVPLEFFGGNTVAGRDSSSIDARRQVEGLGGEGYRTSATSYLGDVLDGKFMGPQGENPLLDDRFDMLAKRVEEQQKRIVQPGLQTRFAGSGRSFSDAKDKAFQQNDRDVTRELGDIGTGIYYEDYNRRMADRQQAVGLTSSLQGLEYQDIGQRRQQGAIEEDYNQRLLNEDINRFNFNQTEPEQRIDRFGNRVQKNLGFGTNNTQGSTGTGDAGAGSLITSILGLALGAAV